MSRVKNQIWLNYMKTIIFQHLIFIFRCLYLSKFVLHCFKNFKSMSLFFLFEVYESAPRCSGRIIGVQLFLVNLVMHPRLWGQLWPQRKQSWAIARHLWLCNQFCANFASSHYCRLAYINLQTYMCIAILNGTGKPHLVRLMHAEQKTHCTKWICTNWNA